MDFFDLTMQDPDRLISQQPTGPKLCTQIQDLLDDILKAIIINDLLRLLIDHG